MSLIGSSSQSYLAVLLKAYTTSQIPATRNALSLLLQHILSESILFQEDPHEPHLWLISLPTTQRVSGTETPDGAALTDEGDSVITFLDDCIQRCLKTPYKYIEDLYSLGNTDGASAQGATDKFDVLPSPLLMTVLEQLEIKVNKKSVSPSDVLALASFVRKLCFRLMSKQQDLKFLHVVADRFEGILQLNRLFPDFPVVSAAIRREVAFLRACLLSSPPSVEVHVVPDEARGVLSAMSQMPIRESLLVYISAILNLGCWLCSCIESSLYGHCL